MWADKKKFSQSLLTQIEQHGIKRTDKAFTFIVAYADSGPVDINLILRGKMNQFILANVKRTPCPIFSSVERIKETFNYLKDHCDKALVREDHVFILVTKLGEQEIKDHLTPEKNDFHTDILFALNGKKTMDSYYSNSELPTDAIIEPKAKMPTNLVKN